jgi:predicted ATPase/class 3 adenylate cyclase
LLCAAEGGGLAELPTGTVTFLFTDIEGSTRLWEDHRDAMKDSLARHDAILRDSVEGNGGVVFSNMGDGVAAAFGSAPDALRAVLDAQHRLGDEAWGTTGPLRVRMGLHTDEGLLRAQGEYVNRPLNRCARLMAVGHGGQVLLSDATATVAGDGLPEGVGLVDLGEHRLRDLGTPMRVFQLAHPDLVAEFPPLRSLDALPGNLPRQTTTFVGRDEDIANLAGFLRDRSLVTLTGVGGVGKTRLAIQVAAELVPDFPDGAWLCELASVSDPDAVWDTLAASLGVHPSPTRSLEDSVLEYLAPKRLLLVFDNCEHLLDSAAQVVDRIGKGCPHVVVLATSREGLAVAGEQMVAVRSLGLPGAGDSLDVLSGVDAVRLFVDRAHDAKSDFVLTDRNADAVAQLCHRLDGIPLAIELAAARVRSLTPEDLVARLDQRFKLLTRGSRAALERHQTLRNTIDWSYDLLGDTEREALNRLSVFAGGADLAAAEAVVSGGALDELDVADVLSQLVDKSLVNVDEHDDGQRYRLLESIRQYGQERLEATGDAAEVRRRHADHYVARAEAAGPRLRGRDQVASNNEITRDNDNFRAVLDWSIETHSPDHAMRLVAPLAVNGMTIGYASMDWAETAVEIPGAPEHPLFPVVASWASWSATMGADLERAAVIATIAEAAEVALGSRQPAACQGPGTLAFFEGDLEGARRHAQEWVERARETGDPYEVGHALILYGSTFQMSEPEQAVATIEEALQIGRDAGITSVLSNGLLALGAFLPVESIDNAERGLALLKGFGMPFRQ